MSVPARWRECITIVSGLPRSGTSMMMQMLEAGGVPIVSDGKRIADADNPRGYYELEAVKSLERDSGWVRGARGRAVKVIAQLLPHLPGDEVYRVIFLERDLGEVLASQRVMMERLGRDVGSGDDERLRGAFERQLAGVREWLGERGNVEVLFVAHREVLATPGRVAERVGVFLGGELECAAMSAVVDAGLHRQRSSGAD